MTAAANSHPPVWTQTEEIECVSARHDAPNVMTFSFKSPSGAWFSYDPGQFLTFELPVPGGTMHRTYTISSSPSRPGTMAVTIKAQPDSIGTRWMHDNVRPGTRLKVIGPGGRFSLAHHPAAKYLFISAGSGVTPMMSMTTFLHDHASEADVIFVNCARRPSEIIFRGELEHMAARAEGIAVRWVVEQPDPGASWTGYEGRMSAAMMGLIAPDLAEREVFCCGPEPFMKGVSTALEQLSFDMRHYHQESFHAPAEEAAAVAEPDGEAMSAFEVVFASSGVTQPCEATETVLSAARAAGLRIPTGCTMGLCGTCRIRKLSGEVEMADNGGITEEDIADGYILACCSKPLGNVTVEA